MESSMAELGSNGFDPSHLRIVPSSSGSGPNDKRDVTKSPLLSFITCSQGVESQKDVESDFSTLFHFVFVCFSPMLLET